MRGKNPFENRVVGASTTGPIKVVPAVEDLPQPVPQDEILMPVEEPEIRENPLSSLLTGEAYEDLLVHAQRTGHKSQELQEQDALDDDRFEYLHGEDWQELEDHEDRVRAARAIARREGSRREEVHAANRVETFEIHQRTTQRKNLLLTVLLIWTALGAIMCGAEGGPLAFFFGGSVFFLGGAVVLWLYKTITGMNQVGGRAV